MDLKPLKNWLHLLAGLLAVSLSNARASENEPQRPFAQWANLPLAGQFVLGFVYEESEAYHIYTGTTWRNVTTVSGGEEYGIDINQGYLALQYGLNEKWAVDLNLGYTTCGWRYFDGGEVQSTTGLMDWSFGVRYQIFLENLEKSKWIPTLTFRAGAIMPGTFDQDFIFAPGLRSASIQPQFLARKHFGWPGLGAYGDALFRWNRTTHNDQYMIGTGLFQQIKGWELDVGYNYLHTLSGGDIVWTGNPDDAVIYPRAVREIRQTIEYGFSYTTEKLKIRYGFHGRSILDGSNTDAKFWVGGSVDIPIGGKRHE